MRYEQGESPHQTYKVIYFDGWYKKACGSRKQPTVDYDMKNESKQYNFLEASWTLMIVTFIGVLIINAILVFKIQRELDIPKNGMIGISITVLLFLVPILVSRLLSFSKTTVTLNKKEIEIKRRSIIGLPIKSDIHLQYSQIDSYVFQYDRNWHWLKIVDTNGKVYRIWKLGWFNNTEFKAFRDRLSNEINWFNQGRTNVNRTGQPKKQIKVAKNSYQGTAGLMLGIISLMFIIAVPTLFIVIRISSLSFLIIGLIVLSGAIFTLSKVWTERKK